MPVKIQNNPVTFSYTPTETGTSYLDPLHEGATKNSGQSREVTLTFTQEGQNPLLTDPWRATLSVNTQQDDALNGTITVVIDDPEVGEKYTAGTEKTSIIAVDDTTILLYRSLMHQIS